MIKFSKYNLQGEQFYKIYTFFREILEKSYVVPTDGDFENYLLVFWFSKVSSLKKCVGFLF